MQCPTFLYLIYFYIFVTKINTIIVHHLTFEIQIFYAFTKRLHEGWKMWFALSKPYTSKQPIAAAESEWKKVAIRDN